MGRKKQRNQPEILPDYDWPFEISFKLNRNRPQIAFLSGVPRDYYPEDPGYSKFGLTYCLPFPDEFSKVNYVHSTDLLHGKPISTKGYGIGGLSARRFAPLVNEDNPAPNIYQSELVPAPVKKSEKAKRTRWSVHVRNFEDLVEKQYAKYEADKPVHGEAAGQNWTRNSLKPPASAHQKHHYDPPRIKICQKRISAFGMNLENSRFPKEELDDKVGVGTYEMNTPALKSSFQITTAEGKLIPRVRIVCHPSGTDFCKTCNEELFYSDYYQTKNKYKVLNTVDPETEGKYKMRNLSLCRECYCHALKYGCHPWSKDKIPSVFMKARHCNSVHDHKEGHDEFLMKSTCKGMMNLARRELIYSRYFKDNPCEKSR